MPQPVLIIHGGAGRRSKDVARARRIRQKIELILDLSYGKLVNSSALEAVTYAVQMMEDDEDFNAGRGSRLQADGKARLSASIMDGRTEKFAGVVNVQNLRNPVLLAKLLLKEEFRVLSGKGALDFALRKGFRAEDPRTNEAILQWKKSRVRGMDTVGACALDASGALASATSTGGRGYETPGRVSDSGTPAANYANRSCAISATGIGEHILDEALAARIVTRVTDGMTLAEALQKTFKEVKRGKRLMGAIGLDAKGRPGIGYTTEELIYGWTDGQDRRFYTDLRTIG